MAGQVTVRIKITKPKVEVTKREIYNATRKALSETKKEIHRSIKFVAGRRLYTYRQLRAEGYPFSRWTPITRNPGILSVQSGMFFRSFMVSEPKVVGDITSFSITNIDPKAALWLRPGTEKMKARPYMREISKNMDKIMVAKLLQNLYPKWGFKLRGV